MKQILIIVLRSKSRSDFSFQRSVSAFPIICIQQSVFCFSNVWHCQRQRLKSRHQSNYGNSTVQQFSLKLRAPATSLFFPFKITSAIKQFRSFAIQQLSMVQAD